MSLTAHPPTPRFTIAFPPPSQLQNDVSVGDVTNMEDLDSFLHSGEGNHLPSSGPLTLMATVEIGVNGDLSVTEQNIVKSSSSPDPGTKRVSIAGGVAKGEKDGESLVPGSDDNAAYATGRPRLAQALDVCGDLGLWVEWSRRVAASSASGRR